MDPISGLAKVLSLTWYFFTDGAVITEDWVDVDISDLVTCTMDLSFQVNIDEKVNWSVGTELRPHTPVTSVPLLVTRLVTVKISGAKQPSEVISTLDTSETMVVDSVSLIVWEHLPSSATHISIATTRNRKEVENCDRVELELQPVLNQLRGDRVRTLV